MEAVIALTVLCLVFGLVLARLIVPAFLPGSGVAIWLEANVNFGDGDGGDGGGDGGGGGE